MSDYYSMTPNNSSLEHIDVQIHLGLLWISKDTLLIVNSPFIIFQSLPDTDSSHGLQATWGLGNHLYIYPGKRGNWSSGKFAHCTSDVCLFWASVI